jgi:predicted dehydrogenase
MSKVKVGIIGCGNISAIYAKNLSQMFHQVELVACADLIKDRAEARAQEYQIPNVYTPEALLADPNIDIVVNLTTPPVHGSICTATLEAGKHSYVEKPLALTRDEAQQVLDLAKQKTLRIGGAPDTFLGAGLQTCRKLIEDGWIGEPVAATAFMLCHGHEHWHPDPDFYYKPGGGPMFDMGPYYLTALVSLLGPVKRVTGSNRITFPERTITSAAKFGQKIAVEVPTHVAGILEFTRGPIATIVTSFDVWGGQVPRIEIYGTTGTLSCPDPNTFGGPVLIRRAGTKEFGEIPLAYEYAENSRGLGVADMAQAIRTNRRHRADGALTYHVLDIMTAIHEAAEYGRHIDLDSTCEQPVPFPLGMQKGYID